VIKQLAHEHVDSGRTSSSWAEDMEREMGMPMEPQGEYLQAGYLDQTPAPSPPAPWYPPQPPALDHLPPQIHHTPPLNWYNPQQTRYAPRRPRFRPHTRPPPMRRDQFKNQMGHVTATRPARNREHIRSNEDGPRRYVPPALQSEDQTSWRSQLPESRPSADWRDPSPHVDPPNPKLKRSDSPNWRTPSPNRPASFKNPSPLPQPPTPSASPLHPPEIIQIPLRHDTQSQLTTKLIGIVKTTSETLQSIVQLTEKLIRQVNASRRLAHRQQKRRRSLRVDMLGNVVCSPPPTFPSGRGESVTGSPGASDLIA
jgi:hypothetical protein